MSEASIAQRLGAYATATIYEAAGKLGDMEPAIHAIVPGTRMAGTAFTVKCFVGDTTAVLKAIDLAKPGDVLVIDIGGTDRATAWGGSSSKASKLRGLAGMVTNGAVRDTDELPAIGYPVYAAGVSPRGTVKNHPGWIGLPVSVGGVVVKPGDIVIGDSDGVVVVPAERAEEVLAKAAAQRAKEEASEKRILAGESPAKMLGLS